MTTGTNGVLVSAAAAGVLLAAGHVHAQQDLSADEVRRFFESAEQEMTEAVQAGDHARLFDWMKENIADGAAFFASQEVSVGDERKSFGVTSLDKQDMLRLSRITAGMMSGMSDQAIQDYSLDIEVIEVNPIGPNAATATARYVESGSFVLSGGASSGAPGGEATGAADTPAASEPAAATTGPRQPASKPVRLEATAECRHLIQRGEDGGRLQLGMSACQARVQL